MDVPQRTPAGDRMAETVWKYMPEAHRGVFIRHCVKDLVVFGNDGNDGLNTRTTAWEIGRVLDWFAGRGRVIDDGRCAGHWTWALILGIPQARTPAALEFQRAVLEEVLWEIWREARDETPAASDQLRAFATNAVARTEELFASAQERIVKLHPKLID